MSDWPTATDYGDALQDPNTAFKDSFLRTCAVTTNRLGRPQPRAGDFANVCKLVHPSGKVTAVRVFLSPQSARAKRYKAISEHLQARNYPFMVGFSYDDEGVCVNGCWFPLQTMEWGDGENLGGGAEGGWVGGCVRRGEKARLARAAELWVEAIAALNGAGAAHGDLQHGNVMVLPSDALKLVDYDCMYVPELRQGGHFPNLDTDPAPEAGKAGLPAPQSQGPTAVAGPRPLLRLDHPHRPPRPRRRPVAVGPPRRPQGQRQPHFLLKRP